MIYWAQLLQLGASLARQSTPMVATETAAGGGEPLKTAQQPLRVVSLLSGETS